MLRQLKCGHGAVRPWPNPAWPRAAQSKHGEVAGRDSGRPQTEREAAGYANEVGLRQKGVSGVAWRQRLEQKVNYTNESVEIQICSLPLLPHPTCWGRQEETLRPWIKVVNIVKYLHPARKFPLFRRLQSKMVLPQVQKVVLNTWKKNVSTSLHATPLWHLGWIIWVVVERCWWGRNLLTQTWLTKDVYWRELRHQSSTAVCPFSLPT